MALTPGTRFGPYEIVAPVGAGGMGEVYRATDTKLGRDVAIKTLPAGLATDPDRLARFEREAKLLAALNHPNIASIYGLDEHDGTLWLAMELVEGETLDARLKAGALPVAEVLPIALQITEALEAAHGKGVIHRDLKPANVMLTKDGQVKVLDFGLAKAFSTEPGDASALHSPALSVAMTQAGLVLGTAGYMSPEQASGQATDQRADIWGFGVVLYEMLTGLPLFRGETVPHILADVLKTEPDWDRLPANLHPRIRELLTRCLTKKPRDRLHSIADARIEIEAALADPAGFTAAPMQPGAAAARRPVWPLLAGAVAATAIVAGAAGWLLRPAPMAQPGAVVRFSAPLPPEQRLTAAQLPMVAVSADGSRIAYVAENQIYLRNLSEPEARPVPGTIETGIGAAAPVFSPDGQWLAYTEVPGAGGPFVVKRVPISGGTPVPVHEAPANSFPFGLGWPEQDTMLFANADGIVRIPANGGAPEVLVPRNESERIFSPQLLPGGDSVLFTRVSSEAGANFDAAEIVVQSIGGDDPTVVWDGGAAGRYVPSGHLLYVQGNSLYAVPFDPVRRVVGSGAVQMMSGLRRSQANVSDTGNFAISDTGTLVYVPGNPNGGAATPEVETTLTWVDRDGRQEPLPVRAGNYSAARISPDGSRIALVIGALSPGNPSSMLPSIWLYDLDTENLSLLTADPAGDDGPVWSNDGNRIYFRSLRDDSVGIYSLEIDTGELTMIAIGTPEVPFPLPWSLSPDEQTLALVSAASQTDINLATLSLADGTLSILVSEEDAEFEPSISPNGQWLAYQERFAGADPDPEINIRPFPGVSRTRIPVGPGVHSLFSRDGSELFYFDGEGMMAASISYEPTLRVGRPERLFESAAYRWNVLGRAWDADPSGQRFLMILQPGVAPGAPAPERQRIDVVLNWVEELKTRVPALQSD